MFGQLIFLQLRLPVHRLQAPHKKAVACDMFPEATAHPEGFQVESLQALLGCLTVPLAAMGQQETGSASMFLTCLFPMKSEALFHKQLIYLCQPNIPERTGKLSELKRTEIPMFSASTTQS